MTTTITIGQACQVVSHSTTQKGYGRQALYVDLIHDKYGAINHVYVKDVFPNVLEHYRDEALLLENCSFNEETGMYCDHNGDGQFREDQLHNTIADLLNAVLNGTELNVDLSN